MKAKALIFLPMLAAWFPQLIPFVTGGYIGAKPTTSITKPATAFAQPEAMRHMQIELAKVTTKIDNVAVEVGELKIGQAEMRGEFSAVLRIARYKLTSER